MADGGPAAPALDATAQRLLEAGFSSVDYVDLRDAETLAPLAAMVNAPAGCSRPHFSAASA